jgi:pyruvate dehydrogenase E1 component alpha subunit
MPSLDPDSETALTPEIRVQLYREMVRIASFEEQAMEVYCQACMGGWLFLGCGQEAIAVAVRSLFGPLDHSISGHRGMGHAIAAGMSMRSIMAELCGRATGCSEGRGGAGGLASPAHHFWGSTTVVGQQTPVAVGLAFHLKLNQLPGAVVCFMGDGAVNQGVYHESLNLAALLQLPVVFIIENNGYGGGTSVRRSTAYKGSLAQRADGYGIAYETMEGHDVECLRSKIKPWLERARQHQLPAVLEIETYRFHGWAISDAGSKKYRTEAEIQFHYLHRNPRLIQQTKLINEGIIKDEAARAIKRAAREEAQDAEAFALASPNPRADQIMDHVYDGDCSRR